MARQDICCAVIIIASTMAKAGWALIFCNFAWREPARRVGPRPLSLLHWRGGPLAYGKSPLQASQAVFATDVTRPHGTPNHPTWILFYFIFFYFFFPLISEHRANLTSFLFFYYNFILFYLFSADSWTLFFLLFLCVCVFFCVFRFCFLYHPFKSVGIVGPRSM